MNLWKLTTVHVVYRTSMIVLYCSSVARWHDIYFRSAT